MISVLYDDDDNKIKNKKNWCWYICCFLIGSELNNTKLLYSRPLFFSFKCSALGIVQVVKRYFNTLAPSTTTSWLHQRSYKIDTLLLCLFFCIETSNICQCRTEWGGICDYRISSKICNADHSPSKYCFNTLLSPVSTPYSLKAIGTWSLEWFSQMSYFFLSRLTVTNAVIWRAVIAARIVHKPSEVWLGLKPVYNLK